MPPSGDRPHRKRFAIWLGVFILLVAFGALQIHLNNDFAWRSRRAQDAFQQQYQKNRRAELIAEWELARAYRAGHEPTVRDAEQALNGGRPFPTTQEGSETALIYTDPVSGGGAQLRVRGERWLTITPLHPPPLTIQGGWYGAVTLVRRLAYILGDVLWLFNFGKLMG
jgi:hypothetical protein